MLIGVDSGEKESGAGMLKLTHTKAPNHDRKTHMYHLCAQIVTHTKSPFLKHLLTHPVPVWTLAPSSE